MDIEALKAEWKREEDIAHIKGWDFSHIDDRYCETPQTPWDYRELILSRLTPESELLDIDTGGGEFLLSLGHPHSKTAATEDYPPNTALCRETLTPIGIRFTPAGDYSAMPFGDCEFDMIINRHGDYQPKELYRMLKPGGVFITQQVGELNDRELVELVQPDHVPPLTGHNLANRERELRECGFEILDKGDALYPIRFFDIGALVWFARIIEWEFVDFSVDTRMDGLLRAQRVLEEKGVVEGRAHRFMIVGRKN